MPVQNEQQKKAHALITEVKALETRFIHTPEPIDQDALASMVWDGIPFFYRVLKRATSVTSATSKVIKKTGNAPVTVLDNANISPFLGIAFNVLDFIQIPLIYFVAWAMGEPSPITLSNNARWFYAGILLTLCLVAVFIPVTAPFIAIGSACLGIVAGTFTLGKLFYEYENDKKALAVVMMEIESSPLGQMLACALDLETASLDPVENSAQIDALMQKIEALQYVCSKQTEDIKAFYKTAYILQEKLNIELDILDSCIGIILSSLAVAGTVVSLFFPPIGGIILLAATVAGTAYALARFSSPYLMTLHTQWMTSKPEPTEPSATPEEGTEVITESTNLLLDKLHAHQTTHVSPQSCKKQDPPHDDEKTLGTDVKQGSVEDETHPKFRH